MSNNAAARATRSVRALSCGLASGVPEGWLWIRSVGWRAAQGALDDQPVVDDRSGYPPWLTLWRSMIRFEEVRYGPALLMGQAFELRAEDSDDIVARGDEFDSPFPAAATRRPNSAASSNIRAFSAPFRQPFASGLRLRRPGAPTNLRRL